MREGGGLRNRARALYDGVRGARARRWCRSFSWPSVYKKEATLDAHAATAELGANLHKRGELIESVNNKAESLAERAKEYRDRAHKERLKIEERKKHSWF